MALGHGITCGWPSPNMPILSSENTPLPSGKLDDDEISMIAAIMSIGAIFGTIFYACMIERIGRKGPLVMLAVPSIVSSSSILSFIFRDFVDSRDFCFVRLGWLDNDTFRSKSVLFVRCSIQQWILRWRRICRRANIYC